MGMGQNLLFLDLGESISIFQLLRTQDARVLTAISGNWAAAPKVLAHKSKRAGDQNDKLTVWVSGGFHGFGDFGWMTYAISINFSNHE